MTIDRGLLILILAMLVFLAFRPQPGRYVPSPSDDGMIIDTTTGTACTIGEGSCMLMEKKK